MPNLRLPLRIGQRLRFTGCRRGDSDHGRLSIGDILEVTQVDSFCGVRFRAAMPDIPSRRGHPPLWWFNSRWFEPAAPPTPEELAELNAKRRAIECPKVNLP